MASASALAPVEIPSEYVHRQDPDGACFLVVGGDGRAHVVYGREDDVRHEFPDCQFTTCDVRNIYGEATRARAAQLRRDYSEALQRQRDIELEYERLRSAATAGTKRSAAMAIVDDDAETIPPPSASYMDMLDKDDDEGDGGVP